MGMVFRPPSPSRRNYSRPRRPDGNYEDDWQRRTPGTSYGRSRKRSRSMSRDKERDRRLRDASIDERTLRRDRSGSRTLATSSGSSSPVPHSQVVKGKGKAVDLGGVASGIGPSTSGAEAEMGTTDKTVGNVRDLTNAEHTVIGDFKRRNRDRTPKALTLRQSVQAHLSLQQTEPLKVSRPPAWPKTRIPGPDLRHGRPSLLERISGMEEAHQNQLVSVSGVHLGVPAGSDPARSPRLTAGQPEEPGTDDNRINPTEQGTTDIDGPRLDPISNVINQNNSVAQAERPDRVPRVDTKEVLERTRIRLAKMKNMMVAGIPPTAPTPPPIPLDPSMPVELGETTPAVPVVATPRNKLLERLESERRRAIGAASGEPEVEPITGNISEDSLKAELRARNQLRVRLAVVKGDGHVGNLAP